MGITARRQVQQNWFEGRAGPWIIVRPVQPVREEMMLKLRAMGTTNDLKWFKKIIDRYDVFHVIRMSEPLTMKGTNKYYRMYIELDHIPQKVLDRQKKQKNKYTGQSGSRTAEGRQKGRGCDGSPVFV